MGSLNKVILIGNLSQDPELRHTQNSTSVCTFSIATTDYWVGNDGNKNEKTEWHRIVVWNKIAENCAKYLSKGRLVMVEGKLQTRSWEDVQGNKKYTTEIIANNVQFLSSGNINITESPLTPQSHSKSNLRDSVEVTKEQLDLDDIPF